MTVLVYGHRGVPTGENTAAAVAAAFDLGADGVEIDVRRTPDGTLVCSHDPLSGLPVEPLSSVLAAARGRVIVEVKNVPGEPDFDAPACATARLLVSEPLGDVTVSSFDWFSVEVARDAGWRTAFLSSPGVALDAAVAYARDAGHAECHPHWSAVLESPASVARAHDAGLAVVCWTVDDVGVLRSLREAGVDGVITNDVAGVRAVLDDD